MISADNFWIELDRLLGAPTTAARMEALMESYGPVWPDIHDSKVSDAGPGHIWDDRSGGSGEDRIA